MGQHKNHGDGNRSLYRRINRWITLWVVSISTLMVLGAPSKDKK